MYLKALEQNLKPVVVVNKIDKPSARPEGVVDEVLDLFIELEANDEQLEFPVVYASAVNGTASLDPENKMIIYNHYMKRLLIMYQLQLITVMSHYNSK